MKTNINKNIIFLIINIIASVGIFAYALRTAQQSTPACSAPTSGTPRRIAIFEPASHPAIDEIAHGFQETLEKGGNNYDFKIYNANGNKTLQRAQAEEICNGGFDLIF